MGESKMDIFDLLTLVGGLVLFLYGMNVMGAGLERLAGGKLETFFEKFAGNPLKGVALGIIVTGIIQSSSATTVMLVGFVNSGVMKLRQSIGIIMGANIGTTVTAWILSMSGIEGDAWWVKLLNPEAFTPILGLVGIILFMFLKNDKNKNIGMILLGFTVLMFGMSAMSGSVEPLKESESFKNFLIMFDNPLLGILAGTIITAIIQSSSASVGILQALSQTGVVTFGTALPIILGQNIGTCITAIISSIGTNRNAKRVAVVHLSFNVVGTLIVCALFYPLNAMLHFSFLSSTVNEVDVAVIHSLFQIFTTAILLPFVNGLEKLSYLIIRDKETESSDSGLLNPFIDERLMSTPSFAVAQCKSKTVSMAGLARGNVESAMSLLTKWDKKTAQRVNEVEKAVDKYEDVIGSYLVRLSSQEMSPNDSRTTSNILHTLNDFERISDHSINLYQSAKELHEKKLSFSKKAQSELTVLCNAVSEIMELAAVAFEKNDLYCAYNVEPLEEVVDQLQTKLKSRHVKRLQKGVCSVETGFIYLDILTSLERISDHCSNIAVCLIQVNDDNFETHEYLRTVKTSGAEFDSSVDRYLEKYPLPKKA